jgi:hypothetical protein
MKQGRKKVKKGARPIKKKKERENNIKKRKTREKTIRLQNEEKIYKCN